MPYGSQTRTPNKARRSVACWPWPCGTLGNGPTEYARPSPVADRASPMLGSSNTKSSSPLSLLLKEGASLWALDSTSLIELALEGWG